MKNKRGPNEIRMQNAEKRVASPDETRTQRSEKRTQKFRTLLTSLFSSLISAFEMRIGIKSVLCALLVCGATLAVGSQGTDVIGKLDSVGGTTWDIQFIGPTPRIVYHDPGIGIHAVWTYSEELGGPMTDRNVRYNFYDPSLSEWAYNQGPDFMLWGVNVFDVRTLLGNLDVNPITHVAYVSATTAARPVVGTDQGISYGPAGYQGPLISLSYSGKVHVAMEEAMPLGLYYSGISPWDTWSVPFHIPPPMPDLGYPAYAVAASKTSGKVCIVWVGGDHHQPESLRLYYRKSTDDGVTWLPPDTFPFPPAFTPGSDTLVLGIDLYPWYDPDEEEDGLHLVGSFVPVVGESTLMNPAEVWHWGENSGWNSVARAGCLAEHLAGEIETSSVYAGKPTLGSDPTRHQLICVWEQFDSGNVEPLTGKLRADVWAARGDSIGTHWGPPVRLTTPDNTSKRFPCAVNRIYRDTIPVMYLVDSIAGYAIYGEGPWTNNTVVMQWVPLAEIPPPTSGGTAEPTVRANPRPPALRLSAEPNPCRGSITLTYELLDAVKASLRIYDAAGKIIAEPVNEMQSCGEHCTSWSAASATPGVYFATLQAGGQTLRRKVIVSRP